MSNLKSVHAQIKVRADKLIFPYNVYLQFVPTITIKTNHMFTLEQIKQAYDKVKTEADFAVYIQELIDLGIKGYDTFITDGHVAYYGHADHEASTDAKYEQLSVATVTNKERFIEYLVMHESGQTDYYTFCQQAAQCGIARCRIDIIEMTSTYLTAQNDPIVIEKIPV